MFPYHVRRRDLRTNSVLEPCGRDRYLLIGPFEYLPSTYQQPGEIVLRVRVPRYKRFLLFYLTHSYYAKVKDVILHTIIFFHIGAKNPSLIH